MIWKQHCKLKFAGFFPHFFIFTFTFKNFPSSKFQIEFSHEIKIKVPGNALNVHSLNKKRYLTRLLHP